MSNREPLHKVYGLPWWMNTRWGRWLCTYWHPAARLWRTLMANSLHAESKGRLEWRADEFQRAANICVVRDFSDDGKQELTRAWLAWRNAIDAEHLHAELLVGHKIRREKLEDPAWFHEKKLRCE